MIMLYVLSMVILALAGLLFAGSIYVWYVEYKTLGDDEPRYAFDMFIAAIVSAATGFVGLLSSNYGGGL